ncbi:DUF421 domain-containing protein [Mesobacillus maritimus]|uniref:YetF domain-containing protein n=1 Tax=Mesobacillus maritimus TaxID=1643336 RepID=UPI0020407786|nr:DUF421 domain-containing protein [Mesobacillus maritimus]MCM3586577.1 DUF421 domain-containing protein [Mesobacillus maritimus]MCM3668669.1 DUF421 domain-containing protein [Mesobacillus maritimus]
MDIYELFLRITLGFLVLFGLARIMGRKEISQMTFFNFVSAMAIGSIAANLVVNQTLSIRYGVLALVGWTIFTLAMDFIDIKSKRGRRITTGDPIIVIKDGQIVEQALRKSRLDMDSLNSMLRQKNIFALADVNYAIFEANGKLSVMPKEAKTPATKEDVKSITMTNAIYPMATQVISDGHVITNNLNKLHLDENWLQQQLKQAGFDSVEDVFFAEVQKDGSLFIDKKEN